MSDIVEQLREASRFRSDEWGLLAPEAAGEIERLREQVGHLGDRLNQIQVQVADLKHDLERSMTAHTEQVQENERLRKKVEEYESLEEFRAELEFRD